MNASLQMERDAMVRLQIEGRGVKDRRLLAAMRSVPRERFVPDELRGVAYEDGPVSIGFAQTVSQPYIVAAMIESLKLEPNDRVLEVGLGSGYASAIMSRMVQHVDAVERIDELASQASQRMAKLGYTNVDIKVGDGTLGWPEHAPYNAILVSAGGPDVPEALVEQLAVGGRMVIPVGETRELQDLLRVIKLSSHATRKENLGAVRFVPLVGKEAWATA